MSRLETCQTMRETGDVTRLEVSCSPGSERWPPPRSCSPSELLEGCSPSSSSLSCRPCLDVGLEETGQVEGGGNSIDTVRSLQTVITDLRWSRLSGPASYFLVQQPDRTQRGSGTEKHNSEMFKSVPQ